MSTSSSLTAEQLQKIEEKRRQALERKAAAEAARAQGIIKPPQPSGHSSNASSFSTIAPNSFYKPNGQSSSKKALNITITRPVSRGPDVKKIRTDVPRSGPQPTTSSASPAASGSGGRQVTGLCKMISRDRFTVAAGYHEQMIAVFKTMSSKVYDIKTRNWSFLLKEHDDLMKKLQGVQSVTISGLPKDLKKIFQQKGEKNKRDVDLSSINPTLLDSLMPFQVEGVKFCISHDGRAMIADDMGLGKTIQALAVADYYKEWPLLIVCPSSVRFAWAEAIFSWLPTVPRHSVAVMTTAKDFVEDAKILILSYDLLSKQGQELAKMKFKMAILDESHSLKNYKTNRSKAAKPFAKIAKRILLLSGTPALSRPIELHSQLSLINPSAILNFQDFGSRYCNGQLKPWGWDFSGSSNMDELNILLQECFMIRRLKSEVLTQLPAKFRQLVVLPDSAVNLKMARLQEAEKNMHRASTTEKQGALLSYFHITSVAKQKAICDFVLDMAKDDKKFLCFAHHKTVIDSICDRLDAGHFKYIKIDGSTDSMMRQELCTKFQEDSQCQVAVLSITAANTGITLTAAHLVLFVELYWNPGVLLQAEDRAHRIGQKDSVVVQYLIAKGTADDHLWKLLQNKLAVLRKAGLNEDDLTDAPSTRLQDKLQPAISNFLSSEATSESERLEDELLASIDLDALIQNACDGTG